MSRSRLVLVAGLVSLFALTACAQEAPPTSTAPASSGGGASCAKGSLPVKKAGTLTFATDNPAYAPWFADNAPSNGRGFEAAVAYAVAAKLGFDRSEVAWSVVGFNQAIAPGAKDFDAAINQFSISEARRKAVDFSSPYYTATQAVVTNQGSPVASATTIAQLADATVGAQVGTTSYTAAVEQIRPRNAPKAFDTNDLAVQALKNGQIQALVVDLPTAFYMTSAQLDKGTIVGQLPSSGSGDSFGLLLAKGSPLTPCLSQAVDALKADGTLTKLEADFLARQGGAPELK